MIKKSWNLIDQDHFGDTNFQSHSTPQIIQRHLLELSRNVGVAGVAGQGWLHQLYVLISDLSSHYFCLKNLRDRPIPSGCIDDKNICNLLRWEQIDL